MSHNLSPTMERKFLSHGCTISNVSGMRCLYGPDGGYVGPTDHNTSHIRWLARNGIYEPLKARPDHNTSSIGRAAKGPGADMWYGWSHRACCGFEVGSTVTSGDCAFVPSNKKEAQAEALKFWAGKYHPDLRVTEEEAAATGASGFWIEGTYNNLVPNTELRGTTFRVFSCYPQPWGRGKWTAETDLDAKQMAIDFAEGVS